MTLPDFQRALTEMTLDTRLAARVRRDGEAALAGYGLTSRESRRLVQVALQPGMAVACTLARGNRLAPIAELLPLTCQLLRDRLRELLDEYWSLRQPDNYQLAGEELAFAAFLRSKMELGESPHPYAEEVLDYEMICLELGRLYRHNTASDIASEPFRIAHFRRDPIILIRTLEAGRRPPDNLPMGEFRIRITLRRDALEVELDL